MAEITRHRLLFLLIAIAFILTAQIPAYAGNNEVEVSVTIGQIFYIEYTGDPKIVFNVTIDDLKNGSMMLNNHGDMNWCVNFAPWDMMIWRSLWDTEDGDPDLELWLEGHYGPPPPPPPPPPDFMQITTEPQVWIHGEDTGYGSIVGVDWKLKFPDDWWTIKPGTYYCTVYWTMVPSS